ncbi:MAG TPA: hypothetical protein VHD15_17365 [Hyphomicrobiales bacterium]|nr:hypothetical protein [Hyphomicrobiales bacterium]
MAVVSRRNVLVLGALSAALGGCDTLEGLNPFAEHKTPLPGVRHPVPTVDTRPRDFDMSSNGLTQTTVGPEPSDAKAK